MSAEAIGVNALTDFVSILIASKKERRLISFAEETKMKNEINCIAIQDGIKIHLVPETIFARDGDIHYISVFDLARLYRLKPNEWIKCENPKKCSGSAHLFPRADGEYPLLIKLPKIKWYSISGATYEKPKEKRK
jgi:hypothetical protein